ncbi:hypothetical protein OG607_31685 [Streptomyces sp. NBC_01537]|uniref:hypothetical protein n=1 Tax=Streptomyces sp. NBC_01537 TaxID=2903896 RepID=UPI00386611AE
MCHPAWARARIAAQRLNDLERATALLRSGDVDVTERTGMPPSACPTPVRNQEAPVAEPQLA